MAGSTSGLPESGFVRLKQILGDRKAEPPIPAIMPIGKTQWWEGIREGKYPQPLKLGPKTTVWRVEDIRALIDNPDPSMEKPAAAKERAPNARREPQAA
jgi:predicted DNA-binding transcriptional regulator AlpA